MRILITGATSGIGYLLAKMLSSRGHLVYATTHTEKQKMYLEEKAKKDNVNMLVFKLDITSEEDRNLVDKIDIDCLINHAGIAYGGSILEMDLKYLRENYEVNIFSSFELLQKVYQNMKNKKIKGKIFVTSSLAGKLPIPHLGCYTSSKAAISMLVRSIKKELDYLKSDITISLIEPGAYHTGFNQLMIDNKEKYLNDDCIFRNNLENINRLQRNMFRFIEKDDYSTLVNAIIKEIESTKPKLYIRKPIIQVLFTKIYSFFTS